MAAVLALSRRHCGPSHLKTQWPSTSFFSRDIDRGRVGAEKNTAVSFLLPLENSSRFDCFGTYFGTARVVDTLLTLLATNKCNILLRGISENEPEQGRVE